MTASILFLGKILKEWGVRGQVKVLSYNPDSDLFLNLKKIYLETPEGFRTRTLDSVRRQGDQWVFHFEGIETPEAARALRGLQVGLPREEMPAPKAGEYYLSDLVGAPVGFAGADEIGTVASWNTVGETEVMVVKLTQGGEMMVPFREEFVEPDALREGRIVLKEAAEDFL